jgi:hypothetical protein
MENSVLEYLCCVCVILLCIVLSGSFLRRNIPVTKIEYLQNMAEYFNRLLEKDRERNTKERKLKMCTAE